MVSLSSFFFVHEANPLAVFPFLNFECIFQHYTPGMNSIQIPGQQHLSYSSSSSYYSILHEAVCERLELLLVLQASDQLTTYLFAT